MPDRSLENVTINGRKSRMKAPSVSQKKDAPRQQPQNVGSDKPPTGAKNVRGGKHNKSIAFGRGDGKERVYPTLGPTI
jgi:hypothetical protein